MRWVPLAILAYLVLLAQTTVGRVLAFDWPAVGTIGPDLLAMVAVYGALHARLRADAMLAAWGLGLLVDLTTAGGPGTVTRVGPMAAGYVLAVWVVASLREAFFRERAGAQVLLAAVFCAVAHGLWVTAQSLLAMRWADYGAMLLQAACLAAYTGLLMPLGHWALRRCHGLILSTPPERSRRRGR